MSNEDKPAYSPGLEGVIAGESAICAVDANAGLLYRGYDIHELAVRASFEDVVWLLLYGELPTTAQYEQVHEQLVRDNRLPEPVIAALRLMPPEAAPIDLLRTGVSMLGLFDPEPADASHAANLRRAMRIIARIPTLVSTGWCLARGKKPLAPGDSLTYAARFLRNLGGAAPDTTMTSAFNTILVLYAEHDFNASTFAARVTASTLSDLYSAVTSAIGTLKGPLHGGANEQAMNVLREIGSPDRAEAWAKQKLAAKEKVMGFGHRIYRSGDSRVPVMRELGRQLGRQTGQGKWVEICEALEAVMLREKGLYANVDLYAAPVLLMMGIPPELNTPIFAMSRAAGWCAHVIEQLDHNRIIRPRSLYTGPAPRKLEAAAFRAEATRSQ